MQLREVVMDGGNVRQRVMLICRKIASSFVYSVGMAYLVTLTPWAIISGDSCNAPWYIIIAGGVAFTIGEFVWSKSGKKAKQVP